MFGEVVRPQGRFSSVCPTGDSPTAAKAQIDPAKVTKQMRFISQPPLMILKPRAGCPSTGLDVGAVRRGLHGAGPIRIPPAIGAAALDAARVRRAMRTFRPESSGQTVTKLWPCLEQGGLVNRFDLGCKDMPAKTVSGDRYRNPSSCGNHHASGTRRILDIGTAPSGIHRGRYWIAGNVGCGRCRQCVGLA